jgi:cytochrome b561
VLSRLRLAFQRVSSFAMETAANSADRYSRGAVILHWLIAVLIVLNFVLAGMADDLPKAEAAGIMANHKAVGISVLLLTLVRIAWRFVRPMPPLVETLKAWEAAVAKVTHSLFYFLMLAIPVAGWGLHSAASGGKPVSVFGLFSMPALPVGYDKPTIGVFHEAHEITATLMFLLFFLHVGAALKHQFFDKDGTMRRMLPWMK